ncbi:MAG: integrase core domain-containing protein [Phycisphaerales bacterium]
MEAWSARRDSQIRFLRLQIELLRAHLPGDHVILTPDERSRMLRMGAALNHQVEDVLNIVTLGTYQRWVREEREGRTPGRVGRPKRITTESLRSLIARLAKENIGWGVRRIVGELRKLGLTPSRSTVRRTLVDEDLLPDPDRFAPKGVRTPWRTFLAAHTESLVATDFFCKNVWTPLGKRVAYVLVFIHIGSRKVFLSPATYHPTGDWVQQQGRNALMWAENHGVEIKHLIHDHDTKYTREFDRLFKEAGVNIILTPYQVPVANCYAESWIGGFKRECLNPMICFSLSQLDYITSAYERFFNRHRPHQGRGNRPLDGNVPLPMPPDEPVGRIDCDSKLGGLLNHYYRLAA